MTFEKLIEEIKKYNQEEIDKVTKAYIIAEHYHKNQKRKSGEPYIIHPLEVTNTLVKMKADGDTLAAGLLHDVVEDTEVTLDQIEILFSREIRVLVDGVTKISNIDLMNKEELKDINTRKILNSMSTDIRIVIIKLADRLHNMQTLQYQKPEKQKKIALETLEIFVPLAYYIGAYRIKQELEDISFYYLNNDKYNEIQFNLHKIAQENNNIITTMKTEINEVLLKNGIESTINPRIKNIYGIYRRLLKNQKLENIHDLIALKIIVEEFRDCYYSLGLVHSIYPQINSKLKDYISVPKTNMYQSLHTTVFGTDNRLVQLQIKTNEMDRINNYGLTEYWNINKGQARDKMQEDLTNKFQFYKSVCNLDMLYKDDSGFVNSVKKEIFQDKVYVYYEGKVIEIPENSTIIDLLYNVEEENAQKLELALVNGKIMPFNYTLKTDDRIAFAFNDKIDNSKENWYHYANTTLAKQKLLKRK